MYVNDYRILLGQGISREKIAYKMSESMRGELTSQDQKYSMSDSKLVESFLDALRYFPYIASVWNMVILGDRMDAQDDADRTEGQKEKELRKEFQGIMLPMILCSTAGQGPSFLTY